MPKKPPALAGCVPNDCDSVLQELKPLSHAQSQKDEKLSEAKLTYEIRKLIKAYLNEEVLHENEHDNNS
jgi:hypothetical protein